MGLVSATPEDLQTYVGTSASRVALGSQTDLAINAQNAMLSSCDYVSDVPALGSLSSWCVNVGVENETWVKVIHDTLLTADHYASHGPVSIDSAAIVGALQRAGLDGPPTVVVVEPSAFYGLPPTSGFADDPVCLFNRNFVHSETDLAFPGMSAVLALTRTYNSLAAARPGAFGRGWTSLLDCRLAVRNAQVHVTLDDGAVVAAAVPAEGGSQPISGRPHSTLWRDADGWRITERHRGVEWRYGTDGWLTGVRIGVVELVVERDPAGRVRSTAVPCTGRRVGFVYDEAGRVVAAESSDGRRATYVYDGDGSLLAAHPPAGTMSYGSIGGVVASITDADGVVLVANTYDADGRVATQRSVHGRLTTYHDGVDGTTTVTGDDGVAVSMTHDRRGNLLVMTDGLGQRAYSAYRDDGLRVSTTDRLGRTSRFVHDPAGRLIARIDPDGRRSSWSWDGDGRLLTETDRAGGTIAYHYTGSSRTPVRIVAQDGAEVSLTVDQLDRVVETVDADGVRTAFEWDADGQLVAVRGAAGALASFAYDAAGYVIRTTDASGVSTELVTDPAGRVTATERAGARARYSFSAAGRPLEGAEPGEVSWRNEFDERGRLASTTDADGSQVGFTYDTCGNQVGVTSPDGERHEQDFDAVNRLVGLTLPDGSRITKTHDAEGQVVAVTDPLGRTWRRTLDVLGRTVSSIDPTGATTGWSYHPNGETATVTLPDGRRWSQEIDAVGRTVAVVGPDGGRATLRYTPGGRLAARTSPAGRTESYEYDATGRCVAVVAPSGARRALTLDEQGRVTGWLDGAERGSVSWGPHGPLGGTGPQGEWSVRYGEDGAIAGFGDAHGSTELRWDRRGLLAGSVDGAGAATTYQRDARGRLRAESFPGGRRAEYRYDRVGRLAAQSDGGVTTTFGFDAAGRNVTTRFADGRGFDTEFDDADRVIRRTGAAGQELVGYDYDAAGRLIRARAGGDAVGLLWDDNDLLMARLGGADPVTVERDADGWIIATVDGVGRRVEYVRDPDGLLLDRLVDGRSVGATDDPGDAGSAVPVERDLAGRVVADRSGRVIRYDLAGRLAEVVDGSGTTTYRYDDVTGLLAEERGPSGIRILAYDVVGRVRSLTTGAGVTRYEYDLAGRRAEEHRPDGSTLRYRWDDLGQLSGWDVESPGGVVEPVEIHRDALGEVWRVGAHGRTEHRARRDPWGRPLDPPTAELSPWRGGLFAGELGLFPARAYDAASTQWLSPDPLPTVAGTAGAASAYTFAWLDPVDYLDPTGLRPLSDAEYQAWNRQNEMGTFEKAWESIKEDPWGTLAMVGVVAVGVALVVATGPVGAGIGMGILIGAGSSAGIGLATGTFSPRGVAIGGVLGGVGAGAGAAFATGAKAIGVASNLATRTGVSALAAGSTDAGFQYVTTGHVDLGELAVSTAIGGAAHLGGEAFTRARYALGRVPRDVNVNPEAPDPLRLRRPISNSPTQNQAMQDRIIELRAQGARDFRVNQQQVNINGERVGVNRPDLQYTTKGNVRVYEEWDTTSSTRGPGHKTRLMNNDPDGYVRLHTVN